VRIHLRSLVSQLSLADKGCREYRSVRPMEHQWRCNMAERETIGLIGLGEMGQPMASRLMQGGWHVIGYDVEDKALDQAVAAGVRQAGSPADVARAVDRTIVSIVRTLPQTEAGSFHAPGPPSAQRPGLHRGGGGQRPPPGKGPR